MRFYSTILKASKERLSSFLLFFIVFLSAQSFAQQFIFNAPDFNGEVTKILPINQDCVLVFGNFNQRVTEPFSIIETGTTVSGAYDGMISAIHYPIVRTQDKFHFVANHADAAYNWDERVFLYTYDAQNNTFSDTVLPGYDKVFQIDESHVYPNEEGANFSRLELPSLQIDTSWVGNSIGNQGTIGLSVSDSLMAYTQVGQVMYAFTIVDNQTGAVLHNHIIPGILGSQSNSELLSVGDSLFVQLTTKYVDETTVHVLDTGGLRAEVVIQGGYKDAVLLNGELFLAGDFPGYSNVVSVNLQTMQITDRSIHVSGIVYGMDAVGQGYKLAGVFDSINGTPAHNYAEIDITGTINYVGSGTLSRLSQIYTRDAVGGDSVYIGINLKRDLGPVNSPVIYDAAQNSLQAFPHALDSRINPIEIHNGELLYRLKNQSHDIAVILNIYSGLADTILQNIGDYSVSHVQDNKIFLFHSRIHGNKVISINWLNNDTLYFDHGNEDYVHDIKGMTDSLIILTSTRNWADDGENVFLKSCDIITGASNSVLYSTETSAGEEVEGRMYNGIITIFGDSISFLIQEQGAHMHEGGRIVHRPADVTTWSNSWGYSYKHEDGGASAASEVLLSRSGILLLNLRYYHSQYHLSKAIWHMHDSTLPLGHLSQPSFADTVNGYFDAGAYTDNFMILGGKPYGMSFEHYNRSGGRAFAVFTNPVIQGPPLAVEERIQQTSQMENILYPNPASGVLRVKQEFQNVQIAVYSSSGRLVFEAKTTTELNLQDFPKGIYLVEAISPDGRITQQKLILH